MIHSGIYNSPKVVTQSSKIEAMLDEYDNNKPSATLYKLDGFKEYRNQIGLNLIRNRDLA